MSLPAPAKVDQSPCAPMSPQHTLTCTKVHVPPGPPSSRLSHSRSDFSRARFLKVHNKLSRETSSRRQENSVSQTPAHFDMCLSRFACSTSSCRCCPMQPTSSCRCSTQHIPISPSPPNIPDSASVCHVCIRFLRASLSCCRFFYALAASSRMDQRNAA